MSTNFKNTAIKHICMICGENNFTEEGLPLHMLYTHGGGRHIFIINVINIIIIINIY